MMRDHVEPRSMPGSPIAPRGGIRQRLTQFGALMAVVATPFAALALGAIGWRQLQDGIASLDDALLLAGATAGAATAAHLAVTAFVVAATARRPRHGTDRAIPAAWRRIVVVAIGGALTASATAPALADESAGWLPTPADAVGAAASPSPEPGSGADLKAGAEEDPQAETEPGHEQAPTGEAIPSSGNAPQQHAHRTPIATHTVVRGDSLWSIAQEHSSETSAAAIAALWPELYRLNREVIGPEPSLIHPGQQLSLPNEWSR